MPLFVLAVLYGIAGIVNAVPIPMNQTIEWTPIADLEGWTEGYLNIPVDHSNLTDYAEEDWKLYCRRHLPENPNGMLFWNFGGPGHAATTYMGRLQTRMPQNMIENFDIIACDPRGIGQSKPSVDEHCAGRVTTDPLTDYESLDVYEKVMNAKIQKDLADCAVNNSLIMTHMGTRQFVHDLDLLRETLGYEKFNMVGYSYGTRIGSVYATLFPDTVGNILLDSNMHPSPDLLVLQDGYADNANHSLSYTLNLCEKNRETCPFGRDVGENGTHASVFDKFQTILTRQYFSALLPGYDTVQEVPLLAMMTMAYACMYSPYNRGYGRTLAILEAMSRFSKAEMHEYGVANSVHSGVIGRKFWIDQGSAFLYDTVFGDDNFHADPIPEVASNAKVLLLANLYDYGTMYTWSAAMAARFPNGRILTTPLVLHTVFLTGANIPTQIRNCVNDHVMSFLLEGTLPPQSTTCYAPLDTNSIVAYN
eukprot:CFRG7615T1